MPTRLSGFLKRIQLYPTETIAVSFILAALTGSLLLCSPLAVQDEPVSWVDAFFTATSAICVTGLTVVDTGTTFSRFGQMVILTLIQCGGLGIMTFAAVLATFSGRKISMFERSIMEQTFLPSPRRQIYSLTSVILVSTLAVELLGALCLYLFRTQDGFFAAVFHSVSAFCNAGFALYPKNFMDFSSHWGINLVITSLIILGGIGFYVYFELAQVLVSRKRMKLSLHTKLVLSVSFGLIAGGTALIYFFESANLLKGLSLGDRLLAAYFQSVTTRTAGFNTLDLGQATAATLFFIILLMFVGASPGSTGGGVKTTSLGVMIALAKSKLAGREEVDIFKTSISSRAVARTLSVVILASLIISLGVLAILWLEVGNLPYRQASGRFIEYCFEATSAFGTVGLSTGITSALGDGSKLLLCVIMLLGRIGPLTVAHAVGRRYGKGKFRYAEESIMIG